jgi:hypothetical protein
VVHFAPATAFSTIETKNTELAQRRDHRRY